MLGTLAEQHKNRDLPKALETDQLIIDNYDLGVDRELWITYMRLRMRLHADAGNTIKAWQLGNNLLFMMGDMESDTIALHGELCIKLGKSAPNP